MSTRASAGHPHYWRYGDQCFRQLQPGSRIYRAGRKRKALNAFIRSSGLFDGVIDFDAVTLDPRSGGLKAEFIPESTTGGAGDKLHPTGPAT